MGGITGISGITELSNFNGPMLLGKMIESIQHRAPYAKIHHNTNKKILLGVRDHHVNASSAFAYNDERNLAVVLDGVILNYKREGQLDSSSDHYAENILRLYQDKGEDFLLDIDGSYAIAIWDGQADKLLLARDRCGAKPLFYTNQNGIVLFGSEIKAILESGLVNKAVDLKALNNFLTYWYVPNPDTLFDSIYQVRPGYYNVFQNGSMRERAYWKFEYDHTGEIRPEKYYCDKFLELFSRSVSRCLKAYPDCGSFLSGGLDSSGVVAVMHELSNSAFKVFTGGFKEEQFNEVKDAKVVADHFGVDLYHVILEFKNDFPDLLEKLVWHHDLPFCDTSAIPSYFASKLAKEHVNVVLTGDFPDQLIGGSGHYIGALHREKNKSFIDRILCMDQISNLIRKMPWGAGGVSFFDRANRVLYRKSFPIEEQRIILNMPVPELLKKCLYSPELLKVNKENDPMLYARSIFNQVNKHDLLDRLLYFDIHSYAPDDLMVKVDRMTSAHGLVAISPFHDQEFVEFIATLPSWLKIKGNERKYIMREALKPLLPEHTLVKKKKGFDMPIEEWLIKKHPDYVRDVLFDNKTLGRGYFNKNFMIEMVDNFLNMRTDYASGSGATIVALITFEIWHRMFIDD